MATYDQGTAPGVQFEKGVVVWEFVRRQLETTDKALGQKLIAAGAVCLDAEEVTTVDPGIFGPMTKPDIIAYIKTSYGVDISPYQSRQAIVEKALEAAKSAVQAEVQDEGEEGKEGAAEALPEAIEEAFPSDLVSGPADEGMVG